METELVGNVRFCCRITKSYLCFSTLISSARISPPSVPAARIFSCTPNFSIDCICSGVYQGGSWKGATFLRLGSVLEGAMSEERVFQREAFVILCSGRSFFLVFLNPPVWVSS